MGALRHGPAVVARDPVPQPVVATLAAVSRTNASLEVVSGVKGKGWYNFHDPVPLRAWYERERRGRAHGHDDLAGALIAYRLAQVLVHVTVGPIVVQRRALIPRADGLYYRLNAGQDIAALAVTSATLVVLPGDRDAGHLDTTVAADVPELLERSVAGLVTLFEPVTHAVRSCAPYGLRGMWGNLADHIAEMALGYAGSSAQASCHGSNASHVGREQRGHPGQSEEAAWDLAEVLIDHLAARQPLLRGRPQLQRQREADGSCSHRVVLKGTCCLVYKAYGRKADGTPLAGRARIEVGACDTCPLRSR